MRRVLILVAGFVLVHAQTAPIVNLHEHPPQKWALRHVTIHVSPTETIPDGTILIEGERILQTGSGIGLPEGFTALDLPDRHVYAGFIESWLPLEGDWKARCDQSNWNEKVHPQVQALDDLSKLAEARKRLQAMGFAVAQVVPDEGIFRGRGGLLLLRDDLPVLTRTSAQVLDFKYGGWNSDAYPNSLLGCIALMRQTLLDAEWYQEAQSIARKHPRKNDLPALDVSLDALEKDRQAGLPIIFNSRDELYSLRAGEIAREFKLPFWLKASGYEYRRLEKLRSYDPIVILPVDFPAKPEVTDPYDALEYSTAELEHWELAPTAAGRIQEMGLPLLLTSAGTKDYPEFRNALRLAVHMGWSEEGALAALTTTPARELDQSKNLGKIAPGYLANLTITDGEFLAAGTEILELWVAGKRSYRREPLDESLAGRWQGHTGIQDFVLTLSTQQGHWRGRLTAGEEEARLSHLMIENGTLRFSVAGEGFGLEGILRFRGQFTEGRCKGNWEARDGIPQPWNAEWLDRENPTEPEVWPRRTLPPLVYPAGAFGREARKPEAPRSVLLRNATLWTCGPAGKLEKTDLLVKDGKIAAVGTGLEAPADALVVDATGKHITPGIIDCHSHTAAASINEGTQSNTAEVRIRDVLDPDDISLYRQLAGGVTTINTLHGSANVIGGQTQVIKPRWGADPLDLIFREAPQGIKFALGENVKQSNWGDDYTTRYPQTRLGVEQWLRDAFTAAQDYEAAWEQFDHKSRIFKNRIPPRRDLELEALVEVLHGDRWIHAHSYRQDEILMLSRVAEDFGIHIAAFQHVLEGYKVAERLVARGETASTFSDWWTYKVEVIDAIPFNGTLMHDVGVNVSFNSDSDELARRLNTEAAKAVKYGGMSEIAALKLVTINPARQLGIEKLVGSLEVGKMADFVIWNGDPLSTFSRCEQTWIEGRQYFSLEEDAELRERDARIRAQIIQDVLTAGTREEAAALHKREEEGGS